MTDLIVQTETAVPVTPPREPYGVHGWLRFYCVFTGILQPAAYLISPRHDLQGEGEKLLGELACIFAAVVAANLWFVTNKAISILRAYFVLSIAYEVGFVIYHLAVHDIVNPALFSARQFQSLLYVALWIAYFHRSQRVKNTYGVNL
jgi:hypothetical protein